MLKLETLQNVALQQMFALKIIIGQLELILTIQEMTYPLFAEKEVQS